MLPGHEATSSEKRTSINHYKFIKTIGEGSFAKVKLALHIPTGTEVAVKVLHKNQQSSSSIKTLAREVHSLKALQHPNIVRLFEVIDTKDRLCLVMEHVTGGDMYDFLRIHGPMTEEEARGKFQQLVSALHHCHQRGIVHRDLKPENILLDDDLNIKLTDFGLSTMFLGRKLTSCCGTLSYVAPEILRGLEYDGPAVDVWSLGVVLYVMVTGCLPFPGEDIGTVKRRVLTRRVHLPLFLSDECRNLLRKLLTVEPSERATLKDILNDPWVNVGHEKLRPHRELPCDNMDPSVTEVMVRDLGFEWGKIRPSLRARKYDHLMATYLILKSKQQEEEGPPTVIPSVGPQSFPTGEGQLLSASPLRRSHSEPLLPTWFHKEDQRPEEKQESGLKAKEPASALPSLESRTASPSPTPSRSPGACPRTHSTSNGTGAPEDTHCPQGVSYNRNSPDAGQPDGETPASPSGPSQGWRGAAGRFINFISRFCFCLPSKKKHVKLNQVKPL
ncbi:serine/threonine-protein kinase MARK2-like [Diceros bicornis minor]|uniref:serine/threonine-protein kinase MARK2-like n=1 Tax=Diceros bicornis minor TaxID=77932 RepID=UPI0026F244B5|nr:serine/threonine-protein kinase MARK2-like [Diceros bicornis minor]